MSFKPALFRNLRGVVTSVTSHQNPTGDSPKPAKPSNDAASKPLSPLSPVSPTKSENSANDADIPPATDTTTRQLILEAARAAYFEHREVCSICRNGWGESERCAKHAELWQLYESALVGVHGAEKVIGATSKVSDPPPARTKAPPAVPTAETKPPLWHALRDAYYSHRFSCEHCRPTGECTEGRSLKNAYKAFNH